MLLSKEEAKIYNEGERLIPGVTHDDLELIRHRSSYYFWYNIILEDIEAGKVKSPRILDLGCGVGHGCKLLSKIPGAKVCGIDISVESIEYAKKFYGDENIEYILMPIDEETKEFSHGFDYVVSRGVLEHVPGGVSLIKELSANARVMIDVPYREEALNPHHIILNISEEMFADLENVELFYERLNGDIHSTVGTLDNEIPNLIMAIITSPGFSPVNSLEMSFPVQAWRLDFAQQWEIPGRYALFDDVEMLLSAAREYIQPGRVSLEIGAGIHQNEFATAPLQILGEPFSGYVSYLEKQFKRAKNSTYIFIQNTGQEFLAQFPGKSVDTTLMIDVIEHIEKKVAKRVLDECERITRRQIVIFTPLGFMPQDHDSEIDAWGFRGAKWQKHVSGWTPDDFDSSWNILICENFHVSDAEGIQEVYGAFFAIKNIRPVQYASDHLVGALVDGVSRHSERISLLEGRLTSEVDLVNERLQEITSSWYHRFWLRFHKGASPLLRRAKKFFRIES